MHDEYQPGIVRAAMFFAATTAGTREDTASINVRIQLPGDSSYTDFGIWDKRTGGELDSNETVYYPGAMADRISLGGRVVPGNNTLSRLFRGDRDLLNMNKLLSAVGKSNVIVTEQVLDTDGNPYGNPIVWRGTLKKVTPPNRDSESSNAALVEIEVTTIGRPTA